MNDQNHRIKVPFWVNKILADNSIERTFFITKGLGSGGTYGAVIWHYLLCLVNYRSQFSWYVAPNFSHIGETIIPTFIEVLYTHFNLQVDRDYKIIESQRPRIIFKSGQEILFKSAHNFGKLVGATISHATGTEVGLWKRDAYTKTNDRIRCPKAIKRQFLLEGTPEGFGNFYQEEADFPEGINEEKNFLRIVLHTEDNPHLPSGYVEKLIRTYSYDSAKLKSYLYGLFVPFTKGTGYWEFIDSRNVTLDLKPSPFLPFLLCWDFNKSPLSWVLMQRQPYERGDKRSFRFVVLDESSGKSRGLMDACAEFIFKYPPALWRGHRIEIYGDPSGYFGSHLSPSCSYDIISQYLRPRYEQVVVLADKKAPGIQARLERHNALLANCQLIIASWCRNTIRSHSLTSLKNGTWEIEKPQNDDWTHYTDAMGYPLFQLTKESDLENLGKPRILGINT